MKTFAKFQEEVEHHIKVEVIEVVEVVESRRE
jgi:hypothetical protein